MGIITDERKIFNLSLQNVEKTNKRLIAIYEDSLERAEAKLLKLQSKLIKDGVISPFKEERLLRLVSELQSEIAELRTLSTREIRKEYILSYRNTYYYENWAFEKHINTGLNLGADYFLNIPPLDRKTIIASFDQRVGGFLLKDRTLRIQREMQFLVQNAVSQNIIEGESVKSLAKNLDLLNEVYDRGLSNTTRVARTELLKAHSLGQDQARIEAEKSGVEFNFSWDAVLDSKVRPTHARADGQKALIVDGNPQFTVGGIKFLSPRVPTVPTGSKQEAGEVINCRCRRRNNPFGIESEERTAKKEDGTWTTVNGDLTAEEWIKKEYGITLPQEL
jgi:hypothetical protein